MNRQEAAAQYRAALKEGQNYYKNCVLRGSYPYLQVLDQILDDSMVAGRVNLGVIEIPTERIAGTKTEGRQNAFAANFMPLLPEKTEFAAKWINLCADHLGDEGIRDPIRCYEYLGRFYVQEGNKRVSVLKSYDAPTILGYVTRLLPAWSENPEVQRYYEFLDFYQKAQLYSVAFTQAGGYQKLQAALGYEPDHKWTAEERSSFLSGFTYFKEAFEKLGGRELPVTVADALLVWLAVYPFEDLKSASPAELAKSLAAVWPDVKALGQPIAVSTAPGEEEKSLVSRLRSAVFHERLTVAFIHELNPADSTWIQDHEKGIRYLEEVLGEQVRVLVFHDVGTGELAEVAMEQAIEAGAQVLFATTVQLIGACRKIAARYPHVRILNCALSMPYTGVRTYYSRIYEGKFLSGAIAGAMSRSDLLGYVANAPTFGVPAGINAFALGAQLTNPRARVQLRWNCLPGDPMEELAAMGIDYISTLDIPTMGQMENKRGAYQIQPDGNRSLVASPYWNWGEFYVKLVRSIMNGGWDALSSDHKAVNYWWGMASGVIDLWISPELPEGVQNLVSILKRGIIDGSIAPFHRRIRSQDGAVRNDGGRWFTPEQIMHMDWLCDAVDGELPTFDRLLPKDQSLVRLLGVYRDAIPPVKEGALV